jgi:hypothetical protein
MIQISGDSGNGLIVKDNGKWTIRGIVSAALRRSDGSCDLENYVIFADVAINMDWINGFILS